MRPRINLVLLIIITTLILLEGCNNNRVRTDNKSISQVLRMDTSFSILSYAFRKTNLDTIFNKSTPCTLFAPSNKSFRQFFKAIGITDIDQLTVKQLKSILLYHIVRQKYTTKYLKKGYLKTLATYDTYYIKKLYIDTTHIVTINSKTTIERSNIQTKEGVIHQIDKVLIPPSLIEIASDNHDFSLFVHALKRIKLKEILSIDGPITIFAPTNTAFIRYLKSNQWKDIDEISVIQLQQLLENHISRGFYPTEEMPSKIVTINKNIINITSNHPTLNDSINITIPDLYGTNGVLHGIDAIVTKQTRPHH